MKPIFLCEDSSAIPPHAPTVGFRQTLLTQRFFALTNNPDGLFLWFSEYDNDYPCSIQ